MTPDSFIIVSYYTRDTSYAEVVERLRSSLLSLNIPHFIDNIECGQTWEENTKYKAIFIRKCLKWFQGTNIVFIDADAVVRRYPDLFNKIEEDVGVYYFQERQLCSGTLFLKNNDRVRRLVDLWIERNNMSGKTLEQQNLQDIIQEWPTDMTHPSLYKLPSEYCKIFDLMKNVPDPVIEHFQQSRRARAEIRLHNRPVEKK